MAWRRLFWYGALGLVVLLLLAITFTIGWRPFLGPNARTLTDRRFESTPERLKRGEYLMNGVTPCFGCHTDVDWKNERIPADTRGAGHDFADEGLAWIRASNITSDRETGVGAWSDDALARAIREGIGNDGRALFPMMPYGSFKRISDEDLASIVVYLRTVKPVSRSVAPTEPPFPVNRLINLAPEPIDAPVPPPDRSTPEKRGEYLVTLAICGDCHTPTDPQGQPLTELAFAGGTVFDHPIGRVASANLTPDPSGVPYYTEELFVEVMRTGSVKARKLHPQMPYLLYKNMSDEDLKDIFAFIKTLKPAKHRVNNTDPPTDCPVCGQKHGLGDQNTKS
jgi:cbb3-type cytochrome c oxidase subunit III